jgi:hypothetical protein
MHDPHMTVMQQYGDQRAIENKLKSVQLGDDQQVENQLLALELERLEARLEEIKQQILLVPGAERQESGFGFTGATFSGDPQVDINVLTHGLAKKSNTSITAQALKPFTATKSSKPFARSATKSKRIYLQQLTKAQAV